jgi:dihydroorotate dehydrogenase electron transfer subunit
VYKILSNIPLPGGFFLLDAEHPNKAQAGQFYMLRAWASSPTLSRPISVFDAGEDRVSFLYKVIGTGTAAFSCLKPGDDIKLLGPLGRGFPDVEGSVALVGGGAGIAPFHLGAKQIKAAHPAARVHVFLGFSAEAFLTSEFEKRADKLTVNVGGFITDDIDPAAYDHIFACGPELMMKALYEKCKKTGCAERLYVSLESRMACGLGACFGCSRKTSGGNRKVCKDGPVFKASEVFEQPV